jgi:hypothetical protein
MPDPKVGWPSHAAVMVGATGKPVADDLKKSPQQARSGFGISGVGGTTETRNARRWSAPRSRLPEPTLTPSPTDAPQLPLDVEAIGMPTVVTHRYHPHLGPCRNLCELEDVEAEELIHRLRWDFGRSLKPGYLTRRRFTEAWLQRAAQGLLRRPLQQCPVYFFLGDFSHGLDQSRPASLQRALASLAAEQLTFTLGDSMTVAAQAHPQLYSLQQVALLFEQGLGAGFGSSDRLGFQASFIEVQLWADAASTF